MSRSSPGRARRLVGAATALLAVWLVALVVGGWAGSGCTRDRIALRIAESLEARVTVADASLSLVRGGFTAEDAVIRRDHDGHLRIRVQEIDADLLPLGLALVDRSIGTLVLRGIELEASSRAVLEIRGRKKSPITVDELVVEDAKIALLPTAILPELGRIEVTVERARAGPTTFRTALSWVFALDDLVARLDLPAGITVRLTYRGGVLSVAGGMFGETPVEVPFEIPTLDPAREAEQLAELGKQLLRKVAVDRAGGWLERTVVEPVVGVRDRLRSLIRPDPGSGSGSGSGTP
jgi:hypothetical protein